MGRSAQRFDADLLRQIVTIAAILGTLAVNVLSNVFPLNGLNIGAISNTLFAPVLIIPANYAFAIWGVIYLGLIGFGIYQLLPAQQQNPVLRRIDYFLAIACVAQALWVYLFLARQFAASVLAMLGILLPLIGMYLRLPDRLSRQERWFVQVPISIYLGWITVATVVNVACALHSVGWDGSGISAPIWTVIMVLVSGAIAAMLAVQRQDRAYTLVIVWALSAIAVRQWRMPLIAVPALGMAIVLLLLLAIQLGKRSASRSNGTD